MILLKNGKNHPNAGPTTKENGPEKNARHLTERGFYVSKEDSLPNVKPLIYKCGQPATLRSAGKAGPASVGSRVFGGERRLLTAKRSEITYFPHISR